MKRETKNYVFKAGLIKCYTRHLFSGRLREYDAKLDVNIALHHFSPDILSENDKRGPKQNFITAIEPQLAQQIGLMPGDRVAGVDKYYAAPNVSRDALLSYLTSVENAVILRGSAIEFTTRLSSNSKLVAKKVADAAKLQVELDLKRHEQTEADIIQRASLTGTQELFFARIQTDYQLKIENLESLLSASVTALTAIGVTLTAERAASDSIIEKHIQDKKNYTGGLQRVTILTDSWHALNPSYSNHIFGFKTFDEYKLYCSILFPDLAFEAATKHTDNITEWEKCTMTIMRYRRKMSHQILGAIWNRRRTVIGKYILAWSQRWGRAAESLIDLDLTTEYLNEERPKIFTDAGQECVAVLVDGKDFMINDPKKNSAIKRACWSDKVHHSAGRLITWSTPAGLIVEVTPLFLGRATETAVVALWGSYHGTVPLGKIPEIVPPPLQFVKAESYKENKLLTAAIRGERNNGGGVIDENADNVLNAENEEIDDSEVERILIANEIQPDADTVTSVKFGDRSTSFLVRSRDRERRTQSGKKYTATKIGDMTSYLLRRGPNESSTRKYEQLVMHEKLHLAYMNGTLSNCILAYYLRKMERLRAEMMRHLNGDAGEDVPPMLLTRLAKIPVGYTVLADRGFYYDAPSYPNVNAQITPHFITGRDQFEVDEISNDLVTCRLRWSSEAVFSRVTDQEALTDVIPYDYFTTVESMIKWGHAHANLMQPFNKPTDY